MKIMTKIIFGIVIGLCIFSAIITTVKADDSFIANDSKSYNGYWNSGKFMVVKDNKAIKVINFDKQIINITGQNCNTNTVQTPTCSIDTDLIDSLIKDLQNIKNLQTNSCINKETIINMIASINRINQEGIISSNDTICTETRSSKTITIQTMSDIIYITKTKTKYINSFKLAPTGATL